MFELLTFLVSALKKTTKCGIFSAVAGNQTAGLSLRGGGWGFPLATFKGKWKKIELKQIPSCLIPHLLVVFTQQLEIFVTTLPKIYIMHQSIPAAPKFCKFNTHAVSNSYLNITMQRILLEKNQGVVGVGLGTAGIDRCINRLEG